MEPTAARNPVNSSIFFFLYLLSDAAASTKKKKNSLFATNKKTGTYLMGATTATSAYKRLSINK
jgi:hypothetical protein